MIFLGMDINGPQKLSKQRQKESYRISMRKLRTFYWKVTMFATANAIKAV